MARKQVYLRDSVLKKIQEMKENDDFNFSAWVVKLFEEKFMTKEKLEEKEKEMREEIDLLKKEHEQAEKGISHLSPKDNLYFKGFPPDRLGKSHFIKSQYGGYCKVVEWVTFDVFKKKVELYKKTRKHTK